MVRPPAGKKPAPKKATPAKKPVAAKKAAGKAALARAKVQTKKQQAAIYALCDPRIGEVRYVGKANKPEARLKSHLRDARRRATPVYHWVAKLQREGLTPELRVLAWTDDWCAEERRQIAEHREQGCRLLNVADGGDEPACSGAVRAANGRKVAKARDPHIWAYRRNAGQVLAWCRKNGKDEAASRLSAALRVFDSMSRDKQLLIAIESPSSAGEL